MCWDKSLPQSANWAEQHLLRSWGSARPWHQARLVPSQGRTLSAPAAMTHLSLRLWSLGQFLGWENAILRWQRWKCFVLETLLRRFPENPHAYLAQGGPQPWHHLPTVSSVQTRGFQQADCLPPSPKKREKKNLLSHIPFLFHSRLITGTEQRLCLPKLTAKWEDRDLSFRVISSRRSLGPSLTSQEWGVKADVWSLSPPIPLTAPDAPG